MKRLPDIIIVTGVIIGALGISTGYRWIGGGALLVAMLVGWKRDWAMDLFEGLVSSSQSSTPNEIHCHETDHWGASEHGGDDK